MTKGQIKKRGDITVDSIHNEKMLILESWPKADAQQIDKTIEVDLELIKKSISAIRNLRAEMNISPGKEIDIIIKSSNLDSKLLFYPFIIKICKGYHGEK